MKINQQNRSLCHGGAAVVPVRCLLQGTVQPMIRHSFSAAWTSNQNLHFSKCHRRLQQLPRQTWRLKTESSEPGNEYELFLVSRRELAFIGKPMDTSQDRRMELTIILTLRMLTLRI
ncbi:hypothetical protein FHG87_007443 [Trinorchestia longiramus]|nr:hypothetical protein FHG87_007443 [Trinorchestia longiramus]